VEYPRSELQDKVFNEQDAAKNNLFQEILIKKIYLRLLTRKEPGLYMLSCLIVPRKPPTRK